MRKTVILCAVLLGALSAAAQESRVSIGDLDYLRRETAGTAKITALRYPTLGCPELVVRGSTGRAILKLPNEGIPSDVSLVLRSTGDVLPSIYDLRVESTTWDAASKTHTATFRVPSNVPEDMYDLFVVIPSRSISDRQPNALKVFREEPREYSWVVIADPQFNDPRVILNKTKYTLSREDYNGISVIEQVKREIRALNPSFAILCGDLVFGLDYDFEYEQAVKLWQDAGFPIFMVPGNHDGYTTTVDGRSFLGVKSPRKDGLDYWRRNIGPTYYSFEWNGSHFQGVNSYDGTPERRDTFLFQAVNYGGDLSEAQLRWITQDVRSTSKPVIPYMHHNPLGPYIENRPYSGWTIAFRTLKYLIEGKIGEDFQLWNNQKTGEALRDLYDGRSPAVFLGHAHWDYSQQYKGTTYRTVTTIGSKTHGSAYWGYNVVRMSGNQISDGLYLNDDFLSVPVGNLFVEYTTPNHGTKTVARAKVTSGLAESYPVTLEFLVRDAASYRVSRGEIVAVEPVCSGQQKVWVRVASPVARSIEKPETLEVVLSPAGK